MIGHAVAPSGNNFCRSAGEALARLLAEQHIAAEEIDSMASTGYGRKLFTAADRSISEISANAIGARQVAVGGGTALRTIINIGGQDTKVIALGADGRIRDFAMNDKCAAGTGKFLEMTARSMDVDLSAMGRCHVEFAGAPITINSTCTVFAASEIISLLAGGCRKGEIIAGVHHAVARRIAQLAERVGIEDTVLFDGGGALNQGMQSALEDELMREVTVAANPQITTAWGAALFAAGLGTG